MGKAHSEVAVIEHQQGRSQYGNGQRVQATQLLTHALAIRLRTRPGHPDTAETAALLARLYRDEENEAAARRVEAQTAAAAQAAAVTQRL
jgi:hypothetical protein